MASQHLLHGKTCALCHELGIMVDEQAGRVDLDRRRLIEQDADVVKVTGREAEASVGRARSVTLRDSTRGDQSYHRQFTCAAISVRSMWPESAKEPEA